jgi:hypothetical protein
LGRGSLQADLTQSGLGEQNAKGLTPDYDRLYLCFVSACGQMVHFIALEGTNFNPVTDQTPLVDFGGALTEKQTFKYGQLVISNSENYNSRLPAALRTN